MKISQAVASVDVLKRLYGQKMKVREAYRLREFMRTMEEGLAFFVSKRDALFEAYNVDITKRPLLARKGKQEDFEREMEELLNFEPENLCELTLTIPGDLSLSAGDIDLLSGVVEIKFEEEKHDDVHTG